MTLGYRHIVLDTVVSTNDEAMARLRAGERAGFVVTARAQTGGRGRQGRVWSSPVGNLYMSVALLDPAPPTLMPQLGFVAGVALAETLRMRLGHDPRLKLKWPNDILHDGAKLAGMLLESATLPGGGSACVVGIGVNCRSHPDALAYSATDLRTVGDPDPNLDLILADFLDRFDIQMRVWDRGAGFAAIRRAWLAFAAGLGERISVATPRLRADGIFRDIDASGRLLLETVGGAQVIEAGDVFFPALVAAPTN